MCNDEGDNELYVQLVLEMQCEVIVVSQVNYLVKLLICLIVCFKFFVIECKVIIYYQYGYLEIEYYCQFCYWIMFIVMMGFFFEEKILVDFVDNVFVSGVVLEWNQKYFFGVFIVDICLVNMKQQCDSKNICCGKMDQLYLVYLKYKGCFILN